MMKGSNRQRLIFLLIGITFRSLSQNPRIDSLLAQMDMPPMNVEIKRVSNNWANTINQGVDTNRVIVKRLINKTYVDGQIKYCHTKEGYSRIVKTFTTIDSTGRNDIKIVFYSLGTWPLQIETYRNNKNIENLYFDKTNLMAWEKGENQFIEMNDPGFFPRNRSGLDMFDRAVKAAGSPDESIKE